MTAPICVQILVVSGVVPPWHGRVSFRKGSEGGGGGSNQRNLDFKGGGGA